MHGLVVLLSIVPHWSSAPVPVDAAGLRAALCRDARAVAEMPPCTGPRECEALEEWVERFGSPRSSITDGLRRGEGATTVVTYPDRRPLRPTPWPPPEGFFPGHPCPATPGR